MANTIYKGTFQIQLRSKLPPVQPRQPSTMCLPASQITARKATGVKCYHVGGVAWGGLLDATISTVHLPEHQRFLCVGRGRMLFYY